MTDPLSRVRAGLARDAEIARAAAGIYGESWRPGAAFGDEWDRVEGSGATAVGYDMHESTPPHIARHDPSRVLRQSEAFRKLLQRHGEAEHDSVLSDRDAGFEAGMYAALELLASIYPEDTTTAGDGS